MWGSLGGWRSLASECEVLLLNLVCSVRSWYLTSDFFLWQVQNPKAFRLRRPGTEVLEEHPVRITNLWSGRVWNAN